MHSEAAFIYIEACKREQAECALELVYALDNNEKEVSLSDRAVHLNDVDVGCIAEVLRLGSHCLRVLNIEGNAFGLSGLQSLFEAIEANPGIIRELRLGRNKLKDQAAVVIGHTLSRNGCGLKVLDLSENEITKLGVIPIASALSNGQCDIVELSLHNNKIEADAATLLAQAVRKAGKLKHLHLGYNAIRDTGASQLAQCIPVIVTLTTLDLTANRIGPSGGKELARALMSGSCNIQRLNLRYNFFDSETIEMYGDVLSSNTSLIQLFLGFMNPTPNSAAVVLSKLRNNHNLLLLDIYGWKLQPEVMWELIDDIQQTNTTLVAIVTDACQSVAKRIDEGNEERDKRGQHPIYIGPDDSDAYTATKSVRRVSRAQSRRQSRASSHAPNSSRTGSLSQRRGTERSYSRKDSDTHSRYSSRDPQEQFQNNTHQDKSAPATPKRSVSENYSPNGNRQSHVDSINRMNTSYGAGPEMSSVEYSRYQLDPQVGGSIKNFLEQLQQELAHQRKIQKSLEARVAVLERECACGSNRLGSSDRQRPSREVGVDGANRVGSGHEHGSDSLFNGNRINRTHSMDSYRNYDGRSLDHTDLQRLAKSPYRRQRSNEVSFHETSCAGGTPEPRGGPAEYPHVTESRSTKSVPPAEPLELPKENKPVGVTLQTSTKAQDNYQPNLGPVPSKDTNPPRRKGSLQRP